MTEDIYPKYRVQKESILEWEVRRRDSLEDDYWYWESDHISKWGAISKAKRSIAADRERREKVERGPEVVWGPEP